MPPEGVSALQPLPGGSETLQVRLDLALALAQARRHTEAVSVLRGVLTIDRGNVRALHQLGAILAKSGQPDRMPEAVGLLREAAACCPGEADIWLDLGRSLKDNRRKREEATAAYQRAIDLRLGQTHDPGKPALDKLGDLLAGVAILPIEFLLRTPRYMAEYARLLCGDEAGSLSVDDAVAMARRALAGLASMGEYEANRRALAALHAVGFDKSWPPEWVAALFEGLALPWMREALARGHFNMALAVECLANNAYVKQVESSAHFSATQARIVPPIAEAGRNLGPGACSVSQDEVPTVGFLLVTGHLMAHVECLLNILEGHAGLARPGFRPRVYALEPCEPGVVAWLERLGIPLFTLGAGGGGPHDRLLKMRDSLAADGVDVLVWLSTNWFMAMAFAMRLAPVQVWWSMKYHGVDLPEIDGRITGGSLAPTRRLDGREWRIVNSGITSWFDSGKSAEAARIRAGYAQFELIAGCFARSEKMDSPAFLDAVAEFLRRHPSACFLWAGRERLERVQRRFDQAGVGHRCFFVGWVDTRLYAQVIDLFLDSFPLPCGYTLYQAMAAGKPFVTRDSPENRELGLAGFIGPCLAGETGSPEDAHLMAEIFAGGALFFCAGDEAEYLAMADRLAGDAALRTAAGEAARRCVVSFLSDPARSAEALAGHLRALIDARRTPAAAS